MDDPKISPLEMRVLGFLEDEQPKSVAEIRQALEEDGSNFAYTTVMTLLTRLYQKGVITRAKQSRRYLYSALPKTKKISESILTKVKRGLFREDKLRPIVALLEDDDLSANELHELRRMIDEKIKTS